MPCYDNRDDAEYIINQERQAAERATKTIRRDLALVEAMLCAFLKGKTSSEVKRLSHQIATPESGLPPTALLTWWFGHKLADTKRKRTEKKK